MFISKSKYDKVNARNVKLAKDLQTIDNILTEAESNKTPAVFIVDKIKEVIRPQN